MLRNVVAIVSGGSSGLGAATTSYIVRHGGRVVVADLPSSRDNFLRLAASSCAEVHQHHNIIGRDDRCNDKKRWPEAPLMVFAETDVRSEVDVKHALDLAEDKFNEPVNVIVNCAGICPARRTISSKISTDKETEVFRTHSLDEFNDALQINTLGTFNLARLAAERMVLREPDIDGLRGCIINTSSIAAFEGQTGQVAYAASKGAIVGMTLPLARDLAKYGIRVMTIAPGLFKTPLLDGLPKTVQVELSKMAPCPNRLGDPDEFGRMVGSILTNPMLNGEVIRLDGALRMPP